MSGGRTEASAPTDDKKCGKTGRRGRRPLRIGCKRCGERATARVAPTEMLVGADDPVCPMWVCNIFVGQGPCALPWVRGKNPPVTASPCQPPLGKGAKGTGDADCHSQCAHWLRNDMIFTRGAVQICSGRCGERTERCQWQRKRSERVAAVKILSVRRKAAQKFWAPQQDHRPLRMGY